MAGQRALQLPDASVAQLGRLLQVTGALGALRSGARLLDLLFDLTNGRDGFFLEVPMSLQTAGLFAEIGHVLLDGGETLLRGLV